MIVKEFLQLLPGITFLGVRINRDHAGYVFHSSNNLTTKTYKYSQIIENEQLLNTKIIRINKIDAHESWQSTNYIQMELEELL